MKTIIVYGSSTGTTKDIADRIAEKFGVGADDVRDAADFNAEDLADYDLLIFGSSTWDEGELQDDWSDLISDIAEQDLSGKKVALFGCGDSEGYGDTFCDAVGILHEELSKTGCTFVGAISKDGYEFEASRAEEGDKLVGCCIDEDNQDDMTDERIDRWVEAVKSAL